MSKAIFEKDETPFALIPNDLVFSKEISLKAKGLYGYLQAKPNDYDFAYYRVANELKEGKGTVLSTLKELENSGYLSRKKYQDKLGHWCVEYKLHAIPKSKNRSQENRSQENPYSEKPDTGKSAHKERKKQQRQSEQINKDKIKKPKKEKAVAFSKKDFKQVLLELGSDETHIDDWIKVREKKRAAQTQTALKKFVAECEKHNYPVASAVEKCAENSWSGFKYQWLINQENQNQNGNTGNSNKQGATNDLKAIFSRIDEMYGDE